MAAIALDPTVVRTQCDFTATPPQVDILHYLRPLERFDPIRSVGRVVDVVGLVIESAGPSVRLGEICHLLHDRRQAPIMAEVVGFRGGRVQLMPFGSLEGVRVGCEVIGTRSGAQLHVSHELLGRVIDAHGNPLDGRPLLQAGSPVRPLDCDPPNALSRKRIDTPLSVGVRAIDGCLTLGRGQRVGIFAGSGVGKSTLLGMIARNTEADVNVIALCGERGREVLEFIEDSLGPEGLARTVVVVATSDQPPLMRIQCPMAATTIAEYFRDQGKNVLLMVDSVTRLAMAQREVGLSAGEPPTTRGFTPSVFAMLPRLMERAGTAAEGSITGLYTVLVDGDDMNEPIADAARGILDGHIVLSRALAHQNHYPAIDVLQSVSRVMPQVTTAEHRASSGSLRAHLANYGEAADLIRIGAYVPGTDPAIDNACAHIEGVKGFLQQSSSSSDAMVDTIALLSQAVA